MGVSCLSQTMWNRRLRGHLCFPSPLLRLHSHARFRHGGRGHYWIHCRTHPSSQSRSELRGGGDDRYQCDRQKHPGKDSYPYHTPLAPTPRPTDPHHPPSPHVRWTASCIPTRTSSSPTTTSSTQQAPGSPTMACRGWRSTARCWRRSTMCGTSKTRYFATPLYMSLTPVKCTQTETKIFTQIFLCALTVVWLEPNQILNLFEEAALLVSLPGD